VVLAETNPTQRPRRAVFFGVQNADDPATAMSTKDLVKPLAELTRRSAKQAGAENAWSVDTIIGEKATKANLANLLGPHGAPDLLFTASHGVGFPNNHELQLDTQGALLCQDWPGPVKWREPVPPKFYFAASDVPGNANLRGMIAFHFACYGLGTPSRDEFFHSPDPRAIAPHAFVASLPKRLLSRPGGRGALAVIGHIERAWSYSFAWPDAGAQITVFQELVALLMQGFPVGHAIESFNERYAELATDLTNQLTNIRFGLIVDDLELSETWTAHNDARNYAILGDPAVKL
jgi:hypothetical protein